MNRPVWITLAITVTLSAFVLTAQAWHNQQLARQVTQQESAVAPAPEPKTEARPSGATAGPTMEEVLCNPDDFSLDELLELARNAPPSGARTILLRLAAERDGPRVYDDEELMEGVSKQELAGLMARTDPERALELLPTLERPVIEGSCLKCHGQTSPTGGRCLRTEPLTAFNDMEKGWRMAESMFREDPEAGLRAFLEMGKRDISRGRRLNPVMPKLLISGSIPLRNEDVPKMAAAINNPEFASLRTDIISLTLNAALFEEGVAAMAKRAKSLPLSDADLKGYMERVISDGSGRGGRGKSGLDVLFTEPAEAMQWVSDVRSEQDQAKMIPDMMLNWAKRDANAAVNWLIEQEPSPVRDRTISLFAQAGPNLAREDAATWALEIQNEGLRAKTLENLAKVWEQEDPQAAQECFQSQGLDE